MRRVLYPTAFALALAAIVAAGTLAFAQNPPSGPPQRRMMAQGRGGPGLGPMGMLQHLNLTDAQRTQIQSLLEKQRQSHQGDMQKIRDLQQQLKNAIFAESGPGDTAALQQQIATLQAQLETDRIALEKQIAAILTADQRKQVRDAPGPGFGPMMGGRGRGMRRGPGF